MVHFGECGVLAEDWLQRGVGLREIALLDQLHDRVQLGPELLGLNG